MAESPHRLLPNTAWVGRGSDLATGRFSFDRLASAGRPLHDNPLGRRDAKHAKDRIFATVVFVLGGLLWKHASG
jgi:hypothetical protein